jgi:hypothetical protein
MITGDSFSGLFQVIEIIKHFLFNIIVSFIAIIFIGVLKFKLDFN